jgi:hypothetical protein
MIKALLGLSLIANIVFAYFLLTKKPEKEIVERVIIETHAQNQNNPRPVETRGHTVADVKQPKTSVEALPDFAVHDQTEFQDAGEKMEADRVEFLQDKLGMTEDKIAEHNKIRDQYFKKTAEFWKKNPMRELNFEERRKMIEMEEDLYAKLEKLHGRKNWERYKKFRENYNERGYKKQAEENQPFIFMGL